MKMAELGGTVSQKTADLVTFTEEILNGKLHFLCSFMLHIVTSKNVDCIFEELSIYI